MRPSGIITLTTDFGLTDSYVGMMKGVALQVNPAARLIDITHAVIPHDIHHAAYLIQTFASSFPTGTTHVIAVDPGQIDQCASVVLATPEAWFIAPDNGVLTYIWRDALARWRRDQLAIHQLTVTDFWKPSRSNTFHGCDVLMPVAAHLSRGEPIGNFGPALEALAEAELEQPGLNWNSSLVGRIIHVDHFGNCITNICPEHLSEHDLTTTCAIEVIDRRIDRISESYGEGKPGALIALFGSGGRLELAVCNGSAAAMLGVGVGDSVRIWNPST